MLIEGVHDLAELKAVGERFRQAGKRLVVAKLGTTAPGARGAYAHTRHVAGDAEEYRRVFRACGIAEAADPEDLIDVVQAIAKSRKLGTRQLPRGRADRHRHHLGRRRGMARRRLRGARPCGPRALRRSCSRR